MSSSVTSHNQDPSGWDSTANRMRSVMDSYDNNEQTFSSMTNPMTAPTSVTLQKLSSLKPYDQTTTFLDIGCGPGTIYRSLFAAHKIPKTSKLIATDFAPAWIETIQTIKDSQNESTSWKQVQPLVQDAMNLKDIKDDSISHCTAGFVLFMLKDPQKALQEIYRVLEKDGVVAVSSWKATKWIEAMDEVPGDGDKTLPTAWRSKETIVAQLEACGLRNVQAAEVETAMGYQNATDTCDFLWNLPSMKDRWDNLEETTSRGYKDKMLQKMIELGGEGPSFLTGTAIVVCARK